MNLTHPFRYARLVLVCALGMPGFGRAEQKEWKTFDDCRVVENPANDGDSFHVRAGKNNKNYLFRLYFVDAPETDARFPERLKEQGDAFGGLDAKQTVRAGKEASKFTAEWLKKGPFTIHTKYEDAMGTSDKKRYYGWVERDGKTLMEELVENGHARLHGVEPDPPGATTRRQFGSRLKQMENAAKKEGKGAWSKEAGRAVPNPAAPVAVERTVKLAQPIIVRRPEPPHAVWQRLPAGIEVTVLGPGPGTFQRLRWAQPDGTAAEGMALKSDLPE